MLSSGLSQILDKKSCKLSQERKNHLKKLELANGKLEKMVGGKNGVVNAGGFICTRLIETDDYQVFDVTHENMKGIETHEHKESAEWFTILQGRFKFVVDGIATELDSGKSLYIPKGIRHSVKPLEYESRIILTVIPPEPAYMHKEKPK